VDIKTFMGRLDRYIKEYPVETEKAMRKEANRMKKALVAASPIGKGRKRKISKSWKMAIRGNSTATIEATLRNTSPHFHLVERGHVMKTMHGKVKGFKQGTFFFKRTVENNKNDVKTAVGEHMFKMLRKKIKDG
jgi:bacteriophage protein of unknown function (DUF646)